MEDSRVGHSSILVEHTENPKYSRHSGRDTWGCVKRFTP
ncbi:hypothetical protein CPTB_00989 [Corynebacterium pseudotuberculosis]|nr:hypothetical protein CPTA_00543 [Corynebacterium pseudotuberculosis]AIG09045.1 hypothetical protein CPTB_00989 [Corynebacterium pseudotuberculosis]AIG10942.1 hypothetical protein CPTC_00654 [Corynebacterium pseudotuberculosis]AQL50138.1 hypothetical protein CpPA04_0018 [Corynebacterium pseudotuberculosis]ATQ64348.1 Hypothetical protein CpPA07_0018 [Corynebacterium pseudotuberculosis]